MTPQSWVRNITSVHTDQIIQQSSYVKPKFASGFHSSLINRLLAYILILEEWGKENSLETHDMRAKRKKTYNGWQLTKYNRFLLAAIEILQRSKLTAIENIQVKINCCELTAVGNLLPLKFTTVKAWKLTTVRTYSCCKLTAIEGWKLTMAATYNHWKLTKLRTYSGCIFKSYNHWNLESLIVEK